MLPLIELSLMSLGGEGIHWKGRWLFRQVFSLVVTSEFSC